MEKEQLEMYRHSMAHILAKALKEIYGAKLKLTIGPAIDTGFYYDVDCEKAITPEDFEVIQNKMKEIIKRQEDFVRKEISKKEALKLFADNKYKCEIINELPEDEIITLYYTGNDFVDLCRGPHVQNSKYLSNFAFEIDKVAGAYWRGSEKNKMLQRIYCFGFENSKDLKEHKKLLQEALERDHRKLGKELGIFMFSDLIGKGLPMWLPNGFILRRILSDYIIDKELSYGYMHVLTPCIGSSNLYKTSGHWAHYKDDMFPPMQLGEEAYVLRPMNCPHHMMIYKNELRSYKDLPMRIAEIGNVFRFEDSGTLLGIERARNFYQNDSHIFCRQDQIKQVVGEVLQLILDVYKDFGFEKYSLRLSLRDKNSDKYFPNDELWERSENELRALLKESKVEFYEATGEAAFYGPKIDVQVYSALGHEITLSTIQLDYQLPERFKLEYVGENGEKQTPVVIHRAVFGSLDRFIAFLIEEYKGVLPVWLAPNQVSILPIVDKCHDYANKVLAELKACGIRADIDLRNETIGKKIKEAQNKKVPYSLIIGEKEMQDGTVAVRMRGKGDVGAIKLADFIKQIKNDVANKVKF